MRDMNEQETLLFEIIKNNADDSNYELARKLYKQMYGIELPYIAKDIPTIWTVERQIRLLKQTYPSILTNAKERQIKSDMEVKYKEMALDENKPVKAQNEPVKVEQGTLGLFGESWW